MKKSLSKLFLTKYPYDHKRTECYFFDAMKITTKKFIKYSRRYRSICERYPFSLKELKSPRDLSKLPILPTLFLKRNKVERPYRSIIEVTSSGTSGKVTKVKYSIKSLFYLANMAIRLGWLHGFISIRPVHYMILGYQPTRKNKAVISKTAYLSTWYTPARSRTYALPYVNGAYQLDLEGILKAFIQKSKGKAPIRVVGFPSYTYFLLQKMKERNIFLRLPTDSRIFFGGGWKQFSSDEIEKEDLYALVEEVLGIKKNKVHEFFGAAEHPILYCSCKNHHFHIPAYAKVIIRDVKTLKPLQKGKVGLLNLLTPLEANTPLMSVMTDDLAVLHPASECGCGIQSDFFEILGRVGVTDIKTCSAGAKEYWKG